jgi:hypothetical protein
VIDLFVMKGKDEGRLRGKAIPDIVVGVLFFVV